MPNPIADPLVDIPDTSPTSDLVRIEATHAGAATVVLNRPDRKNAFDADLISAMDEAFETLRGAEGVRVVFLQGAGGTFSAGADLDWMRAAAERTEAENRADAHARIAREVLACAPGALADAKRLASDVAFRDIDHDLLDLTARRIAAARVGEEGQEGVRAFLERRRPAWSAGN